MHKHDRITDVDHFLISCGFGWVGALRPNSTTNFTVWTHGSSMVASHHGQMYEQVYVFVGLAIQEFHLTLPWRLTTTTARNILKPTNGAILDPTLIP